MTDHGFKRKLTALLSADVVGYSRLMGSDETATIGSLTSCQSLMAELICQYNGRVVDAPGDNLLAEFSSATEAVSCAVQIQKNIKVRNAQLPPDRQMVFRIGLHLGDVIEKQRRLYGDSVNITARMEMLASPGTICISGSIFEQVNGKLPLAFAYLGKQTVKNIDKPIQIYHLIDQTAPPPKHRHHRLKSTFWPVLILLLVLLGAYKAWKIWGEPEKGANNHPSVSAGKPVIVVMPFENLSQDQEMARFIDGLTDDLITNLSQLSGLSVLARQTAFADKSSAIGSRTVAGALNAQYVLEGSLRRVDTKILINVQLIDIISGYHLWAERYDLEVKDLFSMLVDITTKIAAILAIPLSEADKASLQEKGSHYLEAYMDKLQAGDHLLAPKEKDIKAEMIFWESIKDSRQKAMYEEYLKQFPDGVFAGLARLNLSSPTAAKTMAPMQAKPLPEPADDPKQIPAAAQKHKLAPTEDETDHKARSEQLEETFWRSIHDSDNIVEYKAFLEKFPDGIFAGLAQIKIDMLSRSGQQPAKPAKDDIIDLAVPPIKFVNCAPANYPFEQKEVQIENAIVEGISMALAESPLYAARWSSYSRISVQAPETPSLTLTQTDRLWAGKGFFANRHKPSLHDLLELGERLGVGTILMTCTYYYWRTVTIDNYLIDIRSGHIYSEIVSTEPTTYGLDAERVKDNILKVFAKMENGRP